MRAKLLLLLPLLALAELKDVVVSGKMNLLHYVAKELASPQKAETHKVMGNGLLKACKMDPMVFYTDILFYVFKCHSDVKSVSVHLPGNNNYLDGYQVENFDVAMEHTDSPKLKHVVSCPVGITNPTDSSCSTYVLDFYRAAPDIATLESMAMSSKSVIVVEPAFNSGTSSYSTTVEIEKPFSISARTLQPKGRAGIQAPEGAGLTAELNGCDKADQSQAVWEFPGFKSTGVFTFDICTVAPDNIHETWYSLKVNVTRHYSTRLRSLAIVGKEMEPAFDPEVQQYTVHIDAKEKEVDLQLKAEDDEAAIKVDADKTTHGSDSIATTVKMHDNEHLEVGEPPQWSRSVSVQLESADGEKTLTYLVHIKQKVSNYSYLMNLSMDNTSCQMNPPKFQHNVTMYSCVFWWTETESPRVIATMDEEKCPDCTLLIPSAREFPKSHLSLQYQTQLKRVHQSGEVWSRPFLFGESHVVPFQVLSADKFTHTTYHVHLERDAPWWMKTATTRTISAWATTLATCMAIFSASNFVALTRMIQFMDLTTEIKGRPDVYSDFAKHLKGFNFDPAPYLPDMGLPSLEDVRDMRNKAVQQLKDAFSVGDMKKSGSLVLQYCYALHVEGQLAANGILYSHPDGTKLLLESLASVDEMFAETTETETETETERKLVLHDAQSRAANAGNNTFRSLRGVRKYAGDVSGDAPLRSLKELTPRRLDKDEDDDKAKVKGPDSALLVVQWTQREWKDFLEKTAAANVTEDDYPEARNKIPCNSHPMSDVIPFLVFMHELELIRRMMHTYTGTFLLMFLVIFSAGFSYIMYYRMVMMKSQRRVKWLEPGFLSIFVLDCGLIGFTKSAAKIISQPTLVTFFFWKPERWEVQAFVLAGVVLYPVIFVVLTYFLVYDVTTKLVPKEAREDADPDTKMVFNEDVEQWIDPTAREIKVTLEPPIPSWIPVLGELITSHVRSCIPVLTVDGAPISFRTDVEEVRPEKPTINREELEKDAMELEQKMNAQLESNVTADTKRAREKKMEQVKKEKELHNRIRERQENHKKVIEVITEEMKKEQEGYPAEGTIVPDGPSGDPTWFPSAGSNGASEEEEEAFKFEKLSIYKYLTEWESVKKREDSEVLDAEESFAIRSYVEGHIRREKRLTKYNIMKVAPYKGYLLPKEPFLIVEKNNEKGETMEVREACEPCRHWWMPEDEKALKTEEMRLELDNFGTGQKYIQNGMGQRLVIETGTMGFFSRFFGILKVGNQEAGVCYWMDEPENGWDGFNNDKGKQGKFLNVDYADKWHWIYLDKWDLPWSGDDEDEKRIYFPGGFSVAKDDIPLFRIAEKGLMKQYKSYVPTKIRLTEKNEIRQWVWKGLVNFTELKLKLGWMSKQHPKYFDDEKPGVTTLVTLVEKPFEDLLIDLAHASPSKGQWFTGERAGAKEEELLHFTLMKFEDLFPDDEEPWWEESDKPADHERKVMFDHSVFFEDSGSKDGEFVHRRSQNQLIPQHGYYSSSCFTRFPEDTFGKKRYVLKKPDDPVESIARVEMNVRLKHVLPLMRYTSDFKACVPINSLELPLRSNLQIILKESGNGEQFNYTVDRLTNLISIGVLASKPPGPICAVTLLLLQLVNFANRFWTNKVSAEQVAKRLEQEDNAPDPEPEQDAPEKEPLTGGGKIGKKKKLSPMKQRIQKKREKMANKTLVDSFLEVEVFKMFLQSLVLFLLAGGQFGWMPGPICALMCILVCVFTMIFMNVSTFRKEMNKQIDSISQSVTEMYRMYRGYENSVRTWLGGENFLGVTFINFDGAHASDLENVADVNFVVPELGLRLTGKSVVDDLLPQDEKLKQQLLKYTAYFSLDPMDVQSAGDPLPDLALAYYQSKGGDANHMKEGSAVYADFTEYQGFYERGVPHGRGQMTQFDHKDGKKGAPLAGYTGYWQNGKFHGKGTYTTSDGLKYEGDFAENLRHGWGVETADEKLAPKLGYSKYEGEWQNGQFHGKGELTYGDPVGGMGRVVFKGTFVEGKRTGIGRVFNVKDDHLKLLCRFEHDKIITSKKDEEYAWVCFDRRTQDAAGPGKFFYGVLGQDGELGTWGTMYSARAANDPEFMECVREGKPYKKENPEDENVKYLLYHGQWKGSVPDGFGVQHFEGAQLLFEKNPMHQSHGGTYTGDFLKGKRHGRGVWKTLGGNWEFRPISNEDVPNWENDLMHGIGIVEDSEHVHENVIYTKGKCQMPFTELGPPKTGFESAAFTDVLPQASRKRIYVTPLPTTEDPEAEKALPEKNNPIWALLKGFGQKLDKQEDEGWEALDVRHELAFLRATALSMGHSYQAMTRMNSAASALTMRSMPTTAAGAEPTAAALVREPTDLSLPEEDVLIKGGTGENEVINGVYFKLMHTFGVKAFKMVKQVGFYSTPTVRYLYWDHVTSTWTISPKPLVGVCLTPGCAFAQEDNTEHPSMVTKPWYVWHGHSGELLAAGEEIKEEEGEQKGGFTFRSLMGPPAPVDKIVAKSIVGFQVQGNQDKLGKIGMGLMLRIPLTIFGRPVYEYEGGGQYLYFHRKEADGVTFTELSKGQDADLEEFGAGIEPTPEKLYENEGCWVIATDMGATLDSPDCYAFVEDTAVTPDQITRIWQVRLKDKLEANEELRFVAQEWSHEGTLQAMVDKAEKEKAEKEVAEEEEKEEKEEKDPKAKDGKAKDGKDGKKK